jgi:hypothetical protein
MLKFLKRFATAGAKPVAGPAPARPSSAANLWRRLTGPSPLDPLPVGEVSELDDESAWDQWEHSQMELDSRMGPLSAYDTIRVKDAPDQAAKPDPFASVRKRT